MKKHLLISSALISLVGSAYAADLPSRKEPVASPVVAPMWTGFYAGLNAGGTWGNNNTYLSTYPIYVNPALNAGSGSTAALISTGNVSTSNAGFIGGGQVGYNWQAYNQFVLGAEADIQGIAGSNGQASVTSIGLLPVATVPGGDTWTAIKSASNNLNYLGTVRGRVGFLVTPSLLVFGTGGLAYGGTNSTSSITWLGNPASSFTSGGNVFYGTGNNSNSLVGWTAGGGVEWMFMNNWSAKVEYLYYDLGTINYTFGSVRPRNDGTNFIFSTTSSTRFEGNVVRAGVNYHFNFGSAPVVAKY